MLCFTVLSRAADQMGVAVVTTARPENRMITHEVKAAGRVVANQELAVTTEPDQRVKSIYVREGDRVKKGDLLFEVDLSLLEEKILNQQQEMEKQQLTVNDAKSQKDVSARQKASQQAQAAEQYSLSTQSAGVQLSHAKETLEDARKELQKFRETQGLTPEENGVEAELEKACEEKSDAYIEACQELSSLEWNIENAVYTALQNAQAGASLTKNSLAATQSSDESTGDDLMIVEPEPSAQAEIVQEPLQTEPLQTEPAQSGLSQTEPLQTEPMQTEPLQTEPSQTEPAQTEPPQTEPMQTEAVQTKPDQAAQGDGADGAGDIIIEEVTDVTSPQNSTAQTEGSTGQSQNTAAQERLDQVEKSVRDSYSRQLSAAQKKVETAKAEKTAAEDALVAYQQERMAAGSATDAQTEQQLLANVKAAQQAYETAAVSANEAAVTSGRAVEQAGIPDASNSQDRMNEITYEQMELQLEKLEKLKADGGKVKAEADGLITKIQITTGEKTSDTTAILMADLSRGSRFTAEITKDQEEYIGTGDLVTLRGNSKKQVIEELAVESVMADDENDSIYYVTVQIPEDSEVFELGAAATLEYSKKSEAYPVCVPLQALHLDEKNQTYILVPDQYETILGTELKARRVSVTVLEQNESYAALEEGVVTSQDEVIVSSDKSVDAGSRVRASGGQPDA